jgi:hypothetical protein
MIVTLTQFWLFSVVTQDSLAAYTDQDRGQSFSVAGAIRTYAGGRQRAVGTIGMAGQWAYTLVELNQTKVELLKSWLKSGVTVLARDHRGQAFYATFFTVDVTEKVGQGSTSDYEAKITFQLVDVVEGV